MEGDELSSRIGRKRMNHTIAIFESLVDECECNKDSADKLREALLREIQRMSARNLARTGQAVVEQIRESAIRSMGS